MPCAIGRSFCIWQSKPNKPPVKRQNPSLHFCVQSDAAVSQNSGDMSIFYLQHLTGPSSLPQTRPFLPRNQQLGCHGMGAAKLNVWVLKDCFKNVRILSPEYRVVVAPQKFKWEIKKLPTVLGWSSADISLTLTNVTRKQLRQGAISDWFGPRAQATKKKPREFRQAVA